MEHQKKSYISEKRQHIMGDINDDRHGIYDKK